MKNPDLLTELVRSLMTLSQLILQKPSQATPEQIYQALLKIFDEKGELENFNEQDLKQLFDLSKNFNEIQNAKKEAKKSFVVSIVSMLIAAASLLVSFLDFHSKNLSSFGNTGKPTIHILDIVRNYKAKQHQRDAILEFEKDILKTNSKLLANDRPWVARWRNQ